MRGAVSCLPAMLAVPHTPPTQPDHLRSVGSHVPRKIVHRVPLPACAEVGFSVDDLSVPRSDPEVVLEPRSPFCAVTYMGEYEIFGFNLRLGFFPDFPDHPAAYRLSDFKAPAWR